MKTRARDRRRERGRGGRNGHEPRTSIYNREQRALELFTKGWTQTQVAAELRVSQAAISKILRRVELRHADQFAAELARLKARCTLRLEYAFTEAMQAWEASTSDLTRRRQRRTDGAGNGAATMAEVVVENQHGDPRYLDIARKLVADIRKVYGLDSRHVDRTGDSSRSELPYVTLTDEELLGRMEQARQVVLANRAAVLPETTRPLCSTTEPQDTEEARAAAYAAELAAREANRERQGSHKQQSRESPV